MIRVGEEEEEAEETMGDMEEELEEEGEEEERGEDEEWGPILERDFVPENVKSTRGGKGKIHGHGG